MVETNGDKPDDDVLLVTVEVTINQIILPGKWCQSFIGIKVLNRRTQINHQTTKTKKIKYLKPFWYQKMCWSPNNIMESYAHAKLHWSASLASISAFLNHLPIS